MSSFLHLVDSFPREDYLLADPKDFGEELFIFYGFVLDQPPKKVHKKLRVYKEDDSRILLGFFYSHENVTVTNYLGLRELDKLNPSTVGRCFRTGEHREQVWPHHLAKHGDYEYLGGKALEWALSDAYGQKRPCFDEVSDLELWEEADLPFLSYDLFAILINESIDLGLEDKEIECFWFQV